MNDLSPDRRAEPDLFADGGRTGAMMRAYDWASTPLGPSETWPASLRTLAGLVTRAKEPMFLAWGPELTLLYNDPYAVLLGAKHPGALGRPFAEVWSDIWEQFGPIVARTLSGEAIWQQNLHIPMERFGYREDTWFSFSYTPVRDDNGQVAGLFCACTETTAQVTSDRRLLESEENHRAVVEGARDYAIFTTDAAGTIKSWSPGAQAVFGWTADEAVGRDAGLIFTPEDLAADRHRVELRTAAEEGCANDERWHIRKDGSRVFMNGSMRPLTGAAGEPRGFIKVARDETDRRAVFEALARSEARARDLAAEQGRLAEIIRQTPDFVGVADPEGRPLFVNEAGLRMVGLPDMAAARATRMVDYHRPEEAQRLATTVVPAAVQQGVWEGELAFRRFDDGREIPVQGRLFAIKDESGAVTSLASILSDVTERKVADAALRAQELQTRDVLEGMAEAYVLMDEAFRIRDINAEGLRIDGRPRGEIVGRHLLEVWPESEHLPTWPLFQRVMAKGSAEELTYRHRSDLHDIWLEVRAHPSLGGVAAFYRDVTERKAAERAVQESEVRLRTLTDAIPAFVWFADPDGAVTYYNARWYTYTGLTEAQSVGAGWVQTLHPDDVAATAAAWEEARARGHSYLVECRYRRVDGAFRWYVVRAEPVRDKQNRITGWFGTSTDIDDRKTAEAALAESEQRFRDIADSIDQMIWSTRPDGFHDYFNRRWYEYTGVPEGSTDGEGWAGMFHPDDQPRTWERWNRSLQTGEPYHVEYRLRRQDGEWRWVLGRALPVRDEAGRITRWYGTCTDIHDQKMVEARLASIMDAVPVGILMAEAPSGRLVQSNRYMETLLRRPVLMRDGSPDYSAREAYTLEGQRLTSDQWPVRQVLATGEPAEAEVRFRRGDDSFGWLRIQAAPVRDASGETVGAVAGVTALDEIMQAREVLARSREELEQQAEQLAAERDRLWELSEDLLVIADFRGGLLRINPAWERTLGYTESELVSEPYNRLLHPDEIDFLTYNQEQLRETGRPVRFENRLLAADGTWRWISWRLSPDEGGTRFYGLGRDVTAEKQQMATLARIEDQLRQAQKMEAVGQLTGGVAHDFNNLLQIVVGNLELLNRSLPADAARQRRSVDNAMSGAKRAVTLTQRLLAFSRRQPLDPKPVAVNRLVSGMSELLARALGETIEVETVLAGGLWQVEIDANQLENAILNLAVNARDAMPDGGKLTIETANTRLDESYVQQNVEVTPGQYVVICVSDTGTGMDKAVAARVFEPFFTTKEVGKGTGLGLSQVYGFVKQSGGHVKIYSERGDRESRGTTVKIYLPRHQGEAPEDVAADEAAPPEGDQAETVLVVEDDPDVRAYTVEVLSELGYGVLEAGDAHEALRLLRDAAVHCDLLFTDVVLPGGMNGEQLAAAAHEARPGLKVLFTTGYARNAIVHHGRLDPGVRLITKPFTYADLAARVRDVLDEGAATSETGA